MKRKIRKFRASDEEWNRILERTASAKYPSASAYIRKQAMYGMINVYDFKEIAGLHSVLLTIGQNVNQIAKVVNSTQSVFKKDVDDLKSNIQAATDYVYDFIKNLNSEKAD